jgi:pimeloyl-ACP methyl ester carboxylesterase
VTNGVAVAGGIDAVTRIVEVGGIPMSALVSEVAAPRAVILALHGGAVTSAYFDQRTQPRQSLLRTGAALGFTVIALDRPGYGASAPYADRMTTAAGRVDLAYATIEALLARRSRGAGIFVLAHSMGCALAVQLAADERGGDLLGLEIAGIGVRPHSGADTFMAPLIRGGPAMASHEMAAEKMAAAGIARGDLRDALWSPPHLYPAGAAAALALSSSPGSVSPGYEGGEVRRWIGSLPELAARVRIPVHYTLGDHERVWSAGPAAIAEVAALFTASPRVVVVEQPDAGHNLSLGLSAMAYHLKVLSFAEECVLARENAVAAPHEEG